MRIDAGRGKIYDALKVLRSRWDEVEPHWNDSIRTEFEEKIWEPLGQMSDEILRAIDRLGQVFNQMRNECQDSNIMGDLY